MRELAGYGIYVWYVQDDRFGDEGDLRAFGVSARIHDPGKGAETYLALVHPDDRQQVRDAMAGALVPGGPDYRSEHRVCVDRPGGVQVRWVSTVGQTQFAQDGTPVRVIGAFADITDERLDQHAWLRIEKLETIATLVGGIAHDFNNIASAILSNALLAEQEVAVGRSPNDSLGEIQRAARRSAQLVERLLSFGTDSAPAAEQTYQLCDLLDEVVALMRPAAPTNVQITATYPPGMPAGKGDPVQLHQVIVNLITNAIHAIDGAQGTVAARIDGVVLGEHRPGITATLPAGEYLRLRVSDTGPGIPADVADRIFDPFFTTKPTGQGTGLGLATCQTILRAHAGAIEAQTSPGGGATFTVYLPADPSRVRGTPAQPTPDTQRPHLMFVDDEEALVQLARRALPYSGCDVTAFTDPIQAIEEFERDPKRFDVVITDYAMPHLNGLQLAKRIYAVAPNTPIILSSGSLRDDETDTARRRGIITSIPKPASMDELANEARRLISRPGTGR